MRPALLLNSLLILTTAVCAAQCPGSSKEGLLLPFRAADKHGNPVALDAAQMEVSGPTIQGAPKVLASADMPLRLGVLVDVSNSQSRSAVFAELAGQLNAFLPSALAAPEDQLFFLKFDEASQITRFISKAEVPNLKVSLQPGGGTALYEALAVAISHMPPLSEPKPYRRVLLVFSDGHDTASRIGFSQVVEAALKSEVMIFFVSTSEADSPGSHDGGLISGVAKITGGEALFPTGRKDVAKKLEEVRARFSQIKALQVCPAAAASEKPLQDYKLASKEKGVAVYAARSFPSSAATQPAK